MYTVIIKKHSINMLYTCRQICYIFILFHLKVNYIKFCSTQSRYTQNICLTISWSNCFFKSILEPTFFLCGICGYSVFSLLLCKYSIAQHFDICKSYTFTSKHQQKKHTVPITSVFFQ